MGRFCQGRFCVVYKENEGTQGTIGLYSELSDINAYCMNFRHDGHVEGYSTDDRKFECPGQTEDVHTKEDQVATGHIEVGRN